MAHAYSKLYSIPTTGVRFFTVYGPWGVGYGSLSVYEGNIKWRPH